MNVPVVNEHDNANDADEPADDEVPSHHRQIRSFVRREGRMTHAQREALETLWPRYGVEPGALDLGALFGRTAPVVLEIGFGNGDYLLSRAAAEPQHDFVGVEVHRPGVGRVLARAAQAGLTNLRVAQHDAVELLREDLGADSLAEIIVYFPDPWPKKRHHKRRLVQAPLVALASSRLQRGGVLRMATDWAEYAQQMLEVLRAEPSLQNLSPDGGYASRDPRRATTRFESRGQRLGHGVWDLEFQRA